MASYRAWPFVVCCKTLCSFDYDNGIISIFIVNIILRYYIYSLVIFLLIFLMHLNSGRLENEIWKFFFEYHWTLVELPRDSRVESLSKISNKWPNEKKRIKIVSVPKIYRYLLDFSRPVTPSFCLRWIQFHKSSIPTVM